jgi:RNA polymerase sigma-70 factor (ECF subfamily)
MSAGTNPGNGTSLGTRPSLLNRLKAGDDAASWQEFYRTYGGLIRFFAKKAGLTADEAEEVVQETAIGVARRLPEFVYDPKVCRFKTWLLNLTRWRIQDQLRRRKGFARRGRVDASLSLQQRSKPDSEMQGETTTIERIPDPAIPEFGADWDSAWEKNLLAKALEQVRAQIDERQFQVYDSCVNKGWAPPEVAKTLGISVARVYLTKHRVAARLKREVHRLEKLAVSVASGGIAIRQ